MYSFDEKVNRLNTASSKWDVAENELPMSLADMDFKTCPAVIEALENRIQIGAFGYSYDTLRWKNAICGWWSKYHGLHAEPNNVMFSTGVIPTISACVNRVTNIGDNIVVLTPVYNIFFNCIINHGRHAVESKLIYENNQYSIDFKDLEKKLANPLTTMLILCNPHNPIGKIWTIEELQKINELCLKYDVVVLSDEIHCDLVDEGSSYIPFASINEDAKNISITCVSTSKAFNLAGLQGAAVIVYNTKLRNIVNRAINSYEVAEPNFFVIDAMTAALEYGRDWLNELNVYILKNKQYALSFIEKNIPNLTVVDGHATYLLWLDFSKFTNDTDILADFIREKTGLILSKGSNYRGNGNLFLRMNIATQLERVVDGLNRLKLAIELYNK